MKHIKDKTQTQSVENKGHTKSKSGIVCHSNNSYKANKKEVSTMDKKLINKDITQSKNQVQSKSESETQTQSKAQTSSKVQVKNNKSYSSHDGSSLKNGQLVGIIFHTPQGFYFQDHLMKSTS